MTSAPAINAPVSAAATTRKPLLLIVDDEPGPRESLRIVFKDRFECVVATSGRDGIEKARHHSPDVAILDIKMPDISGVEVLRELKLIDSNIECILLTGYETVETARAAVHYGAAEYMNKPFDVFAIREVIDKCLARRRRKLDTEASVHELQQINNDLSKTVAAAARTNTADVLSAGVVHEINNPLTIIAGYVQLLNRDLNKLTSNNPTATQNIQLRLDGVQREIHRCKEIADRFLRFSRAPRDQTEIVDVAPLLEDTSLLLRAHPACGQVHILAGTHDSTLPIRVASVEIMQILVNLGVNGLQAMNGKGTLRYTAIRADALPADCVYRSQTPSAGPFVRISVSDTGCGIAPENIQKIFTAYFTTKPEGNGLGLAVVCELANKYGGAIEVTSVLGQGTTFNLFLPLAL